MAKKTSEQPQTVDVLPAEHPDAGLIQTDGMTVAAFLNGLVPFFRTATELEWKAHQALAHAKALKPPTNGDEDAEVQRFIVQTSAQRKVIETHWGVAQVFHAVHKKLVAGRTRGTQPLEQAAAIAQGLHNAYVQAEQRKAQMEQARLQREAEAQARKDREAELERLEAEALKAEAASEGLSDREKRFVELVAYGFNGEVTSARTAGYKDPGAMAERLMAMPKIQAAIKALQEAQAMRLQAEAVKAAPVSVVVPTVTADVQKAGSDRTTWGAEVFDAEAFMAAALDPRTRMQLGIPAEVLTFSQPKMNEWARQGKEAINKWPGVRAVKTTRTV